MRDGSGASGKHIRVFSFIFLLVNFVCLLPPVPEFEKASGTGLFYLIIDAAKRITL